MSTEQDQVRAMAERIARRVSQVREVDDGVSARVEGKGDVGDELAAMRESLEELKQRLVQIESHVTKRSNDASQSVSASHGDEQERSSRQHSSSSNGVRSPWLSGMYVPATHPSQERFGIEEAAVSELVDFFEKEKKCEIEPGGKPCDHCAMCSTRGF
ncbi:MAG TPA: hypothetical protein VF779_01370 [Pyrinomonadaceae bacterium]